MFDFWNADRFINSTYSIIGVTINCIAAAAGLVIIYFGTFNISTNTQPLYFTLIPNDIEPYAILWIVGSLCFAARLLMRKINKTPDVINPICPFCGGMMETTVLHCIKCGKRAGEFGQ